MVVEALPPVFFRYVGALEEKEDLNQLSELLSRSICELSNEISARTKDELGLEGLGSTVVAAFFTDSGRNAIIAHLGDSDAFLTRDSRITRLTCPHTLTQLLLDRGEIQIDELKSHPARGHLTKYVGMIDCPPPDTSSFEILPGDRLLLCTDGLSGSLTQKQINEVMLAEECLSNCCKALVQLAISLDATDDISVLVCEIES